VNARATPLSPQKIQAIREGLTRAQALANAGQPQPAEVICQRILADAPGEPNALHLLGLMAFNKGDPNKAIGYLRQACQSAHAPALYFSNLTEMLRQRGLLAEAQAFGRQAVDRDPKLVSAWNNLGIVLQECGELDESRLCLEKVVGLEPNNAEAHNNLGNTFKRLGNISKAEKHWRRALALKPHYAETYSNLANLFNEQGQYDKALEYGQRAIDLNPLLLDAYVNLAAAESSRWRHTSALVWLDLLLSIAPDSAMALATRAVTLKELDRMDEALENAERAIAIQPESADVQSAYGTTLLTLGRFEEAIIHFDHALTFPTVSRERILLSRANAYEENGKSDEALQQLDAILSEFPNSAGALYSRADLVKFEANDPALRKMQEMIRANGVQSDAERMSLNFALGKAFLDLGESDKAFRHLNEGNKMKRAIVQYDADATHQWMASLAKTFTPDIFQKFSGSGSPSPMPIFIVGMPRSGTTLLEQILASHPLIHGAGELKFISRIVDKFDGMPDAMKAITADTLNAMGEDYLAKIEPLAHGKRHVVDKMPANFMHTGLIHLMLPHAKIIHSRRNPVDTCLSCYSKLFGGEQSFTYNLTELGRFHRDYQTLMGHWRSVLPASHFIEIDYEDVVDDIETQARRLLEFINVPWDPNCLEFYQTKRPIRTASVNQVRKPVYTSSSGRWLKHANNLKPLLKALELPH
jgi:tetratricopeptide (TPR) repeat protein